MIYPRMTGMGDAASAVAAAQALNPCRVPYDDSTVTTGWSCPPNLPSLQFHNAAWGCTDGKLWDSPTYLNQKNILTHPECWQKQDWIGLGIVAAELLLLPGWWKILIVPTVIVLGLSELSL